MNISDLLDNNLFINIHKEELESIMRWCKDHDWCENVGYDPDTGMLWVESTDEDYPYVEFKKVRDLELWAGY